MRTTRIASLIALLGLCGCSTTPGPSDHEATVAATSFSITSVQDTSGTMIQARRGHAIALMGDGHVLACGGTADGTLSLATCETYDPSTGKWTAGASMATARRGASAVVLHDTSVLLCGGGTPSCERFDPGTGVWAPSSPMAVSRTNATLTSLRSGKVLAVGGDASGAAEVFDPATGDWHAAGMVAPRELATSTRLGDGRVLLVGGTSAGAARVEADLFDPATETWSPAPALPSPRTGHTATRLRDGRVWVAGGGDGTTEVTATVAFDEALNLWKTSTAPLAHARKNHAAVLLPSGAVALIGGSSGTSPIAGIEVFDPLANQSVAASPLKQGREGAGAVVLAGGDVLIAGGANATGAVAFSERFVSATMQSLPASETLALRVRQAQALLPNGTALLTGGIDSPTSIGAATTEVYDPPTDTWTASATMAQGRQRHTETLLLNGKVLVVGGYVATNPATYLSSAELYDPGSNTWAPAGAIKRGRYLHQALTMPDGRLLILCGADEYSDMTRVDRYDPSSGAWDQAAPMSTARWNCTGTVLPNGKVLAVGEGLLPGTERKAELYDGVTNTWSAATSTLGIRSDHTATLLASGKVLVVGGSGSGGASTTTELYDPDQNTWTLAAPLPDPRAGHQAIALPDGRVVVIGGEPNVYPSANRSLVYDPQTDSWATVDDVFSRTEFTAHPLFQGGVLSVGGFGPGASSLFDQGLGFQPSWRPVISGGPAAAAPGATIRLEGAGLRGASQASGGGSVGGASDLPLASLLSFDGAAVRWLKVREFGDDHVTLEIPPHVPRGFYLVTVIVSGVPAVAVALDVRGEIGDPCGDDAGCLSGHACVDRVCCAASSCPTCQSCALPGTEGQCAALGAFVDDTNPPGACTADKTCDGAGQCKLDLGAACTGAVQCAANYCVDGVCCAASCDGFCMACDVAGSEGTCTFVPPGGQDPWPSGDACVAPQACDGAGACKQGNGVLCAIPEDCGSGFCVDGVCCESACAEVCRSCVVPGSSGTCAPSAAMSADPPGCSTGYACDGQGACKAANGQACSADGDCASEHCADGLCCDSACTGDCVACGLSGQEGTCAAVGFAVSHGGCSGDSVCDGQGACKQQLGAKCADGSGCILGFCVDGRCCDRACTGQCEACDVGSALGTCSPVDGLPHGNRPSCGGPTGPDPCSASACLGGASTTTCLGKAGLEQSCRAPSCSSGVAVQRAFCDGSGSCPPALTVSCDLYACGPDVCLTSCEADTDCADPIQLRCDTAIHRCIAREGAVCDGDYSVVSPSGAHTDCRPYLCSRADAGGGDQCLRACASTTDCVPGFVCDKLQGDGVCVQPSDERGDDASGCGCRVAESRHNVWWWFAVLAALGATCVRIGAARRERRE